MANENAPREYNDYVLYEQQGPVSFLKAKMDWAPIDKIHLSFVQHTGRAKG